MEQQPLCALAREPETRVVTVENGSGSGYGGSFVWGLIWFIIIAIIVWLILIAVRPTWVQQVDPTTGLPNGVVDNGKAVLWAIFIALIIILVIWLLYAAFSYGGSSRTVVVKAD